MIKNPEDSSQSAEQNAANEHLRAGTTVDYYSILLPTSLKDAYGPQVLPYFNPESVATNISYLERLAKTIEDDFPKYGEIPDIKNAYSLLKKIISLYERYKPLLSTLKDMPTVESRLRAKGKLLESPLVAPDSLDDVSDAFLAQLRQATHELVVTSTSHVSGYAELKALSQLVREQGGKIGVLILDRHADIYSAGNQRINKGTFLRNLLQEGTVQVASILGVAEYFTLALENETNPFQSDSVLHPTAEFYHQHKDQLMLFSDASFYGLHEPNTSEKSFSKEKFKAAVAKSLQQFQKNGVTHVFVQLDPDVLRLEKMRYTPPDYNPLNYFINLGLQDLRRIRVVEFPKALRQVVGLPPGMGNLGSYLFNKKFGENPQTSVGIPLAAVGITLDMLAHMGKELGLSFGINLPSGGASVLSITELANPDAGGKMTRVVTNLGQLVTNLRKEIA